MPATGNSRFVFPLHALAEAIRLANQFDDMGMVSEPVDQSHGEAFVSEGFMMPPSWIA
jgi:hypothetical protein